MNRPLYYDYPETDNAYRFEDEYLFGSDILVAPVYTPAVDGLSERKIWLPEGAWWDVSKNELKEGNRTFTDKFTTDEFPYYFRAGSIIPNYTVQRTVQTVPDTIVLRVVPGADGSGRLYEDNGNNQEYASGKFTNTCFHQTRTDNSVTLTIDAREGSFDNMPANRAWRVEFLGCKSDATSIMLDGDEAPADNVSYNEKKKVLSVVIPKASASLKHEIVLSMPVDDTPEQVGEVASYEENEPNTSSAVSGQLYISGSAVPEGIAMLECHSDGTFKFHGHLVPGELYIMDKAKQSGTTKYCKPRTTDMNIITNNASYSVAYGTSGAAWMVDFESDHFRFTVNPSSTTVSGEIFTPWYECWIVGGCTAPDQQSGWFLEKGKQMTQNPENLDEWVWTGHLGVYPANDQGNRMKISGQYGWEPKRLCPYAVDEPLIGSTKVIYNNPNDNKWTISKTGYYTVKVNPFRETISAVYHGEDENSVSVRGVIVDEEKPEYYDLQGRRVQNPRSGIYISNGKIYLK